MRRLLGLAGIVTLIGIATVASLAAVILKDDPRASSASAIALAFGAILAIVGAIALYRRQPELPAEPEPQSEPRRAVTVRRRKTWSGKEWDGFRPTMYHLDFQKVWELPLVIKRDGAKQDGRPTTVGDFLVEILPNRFKPVSIEELPAGSAVRQHEPEKIQISSGLGLVDTKITKGDKQFTLDGFKTPSFSTEILTAVLELENHGVSCSDTAWFWYDSDSVVDDVDDSYTFFVACGERIVREVVAFHDSDNSGFDPSVFRLSDNEEHIWQNEEAWHDATVRLWYRKFYRETPIGQLFVLRSDEPPLFHYPEGRWDEARVQSLVELAQHIVEIRRTLWVVVFLLVLVLFALWR